MRLIVLGTGIFTRMPRFGARLTTHPKGATKGVPIAEQETVSIAPLDLDVSHLREDRTKDAPKLILCRLNDSFRFAELHQLVSVGVDLIFKRPSFGGEALSSLIEPHTVKSQKDRYQPPPNKWDTRRLLRMTEVSQQLGIDRSMCYKLIQAGQLKTVRIGKSLRVRVEDLEVYMSSLEDAYGASGTL